MTSPSKKPRFSIHLAIQNGETEFIEKLIYYNCLPENINALDGRGLSPLHMAVLYKHEKIVELLLKNGANVNKKTNGKAILQEIKEMLIEFEPHSLSVYYDLIDSDLYTKLTPLHLATITGSLKVVRLLIEYGAYVNMENDQGLRPIHSAIHCGVVDVVSILFENKATLGNSNNSKRFLGAEDLVNFATEKGSIEVIKLLFEKGIRIKGTKAMQIAMDEKDMDILKVLVENGAMVDSLMTSPLHRLDWELDYDARLEMMQFLIDHGANVDSLGGMEFEETLLHRAARIGEMYLAKFMIRNGANLDCKTGPKTWGDNFDDYIEAPADSTPLHLAIRDGKLEIAELLITLGAGVNIPNAKAKTALHWAVEYENGKMIQALIHNGANVEALIKCEECEANGYRTCAPKPLEISLEKKKINAMKMFLYVNLHK